MKNIYLYKYRSFVLELICSHSPFVPKLLLFYSYQYFLIRRNHLIFCVIFHISMPNIHYLLKLVILQCHLFYGIIFFLESFFLVVIIVTMWWEIFFNQHIFRVVFVDHFKYWLSIMSFSAYSSTGELSNMANLYARAFVL